MNYNGMYRSNTVPVTDASDVQRWFCRNVESCLDDAHIDDDETVVDLQTYVMDGSVEIKEQPELSDELWLGSTATTFGVWDNGIETNKTEEFLERLSEFIEDDLRIRSIGSTGLRHVPDAYEWRVDPDGNVEMVTFEECGENRKD